MFWSAEECRSKVKALRFKYRNAKPQSSFWGVSRKWAVYNEFCRVIDMPNNSGVSQDPVFGETFSETTSDTGNADRNDPAEDGGDSAKSMPLPTHHALPKGERAPKAQPTRIQPKRTPTSTKSRPDEEDPPVPTSGVILNPALNPVPSLNPTLSLTGLEELVSNSITQLLQHQRQAELRQLAWEKKRLRLMLVSEERHHREQRQHQEHMLRMISRMATTRQHCCCCTSKVKGHCRGQNQIQVMDDEADLGSMENLNDDSPDAKNVMETDDEDDVESNDIGHVDDVVFDNDATKWNDTRDTPTKDSSKTEVTHDKDVPKVVPKVCHKTSRVVSQLKGANFSSDVTHVSDVISNSDIVVINNIPSETISLLKNLQHK